MSKNNYRTTQKHNNNICMEKVNNATPLHATTAGSTIHVNAYIYMYGCVCVCVGQSTCRKHRTIQADFSAVAMASRCKNNNNKNNITNKQIVIKVALPSPNVCIHTYTYECTRVCFRCPKWLTKYLVQH